MFFPTPDVIGKLAAGKLLQPLNKSYLPEPDQRLGVAAGPVLRPGLRVHGARTRSTRPGIGYRIDAVAKTPDELRQPATTSSGTRPTPARSTSSRTTARCSAWRCCGASPTPTSTPRTPARSTPPLADVVRARPTSVNVKVGAEAYTRAAREAGAGSTSAGRATSSTRSTTCPRARRSTTSATGTRRTAAASIGSDTHRRPAQRREAGARPRVPRLPARRRRTPSRTTAGSATSRRRTSLDPDSVVADEYVPAHLASAVVRPEDFDDGPAAAAADAGRRALWDDAWSKFTAGG